MEEAKTQNRPGKPWWQRLGTPWPAVFRLARPRKRLRVLETLQLGEKRQLLVVAVGERQLLVGAAANFLATLAEVEPATEGALPE